MGNLHHALAGKDQIHAAHAFTYADEAARLADTALDASHLYKLFLQQTTPGETGPSLWMLTAVSPSFAWKRVGPETAANSFKWSGSSKTVSTAGPSGGNDGDIWLQYF